MAKRKKLTPKERSQRARENALKMHSLHDARETSAKGRAAFLAKFETQVDPHGKLDPDEREKRARLALRSYMSRLSRKGVRARRRK